jgi:hypothetical protein
MTHEKKLTAMLDKELADGRITQADHLRGRKEVLRQMGAAKAKAAGTTEQPKQHPMSAQQIAILVCRCNGGDEMTAISARAHAGRHGINWKEA